MSDLRTQLQRALTSIDESPKGLKWVADETGVPESKLRSCIGGPLLTPDVNALTDDEVTLVYGWYLFGP